MSTLKVDGIRSNSATSDAISLVDNGTCTANITNNLSNRNLIINGAMQVAQRGTSFTASASYPVDRFRTYWGGADENPTVAQVDVASGTTPYTLGFRKAIKITNGDQSGGAGTGDYLFLRYKVEAQDLAESGWNYTSASSYITLSFWVKSSVPQTFQCRLETQDGTKKNYPFETGSLSQDTWTKVTKTIPGNSNITVENDTGTGLELWWELFRGTSETDNSVTNEAWGDPTTNRTKDQTATWWTTDNATYEITGVQLEVSDYATDFEHRPFAVEERLSKRYFCKYDGPLNINFVNEHANNKKGYLHFPYEEVMRDTPSVTFSSVNISRPQVSVGISIDSASNIQSRCFNVVSWASGSNIGSTGDTYYRMSVSSSGGYITCDAEL